MDPRPRRQQIALAITAILFSSSAHAQFVSDELLLQVADWAVCLNGPIGGLPQPLCEAYDANADIEIDLRDFAAFQAQFLQQTGCFDNGDATNSLDASLTINRNASTTYPETIVIGELDINLLVIEGAPLAPYQLSACNFTTGTSQVLRSGNLNELGRDEVVISPLQFAAGDVLVFQATVADAVSPTTQHKSMATRAQVVRTMASSVAWIMPIGSLADIRGPVMGLTDNSINVGNLVFQTGPETVFANVGSLAELALGDWVVIDGEFRSGGGFTAFEIGLEDSKPEVRLSGRVQGIGPAGVVMLGVSIFTNSSTTFYDLATNEWVTLDAIEPGMPIEVNVAVETPFPSATTVFLNIPVELEPEPEPEEEPEEESEDPPPAPPFCS